MRGFALPTPFQKKHPESSIFVIQYLLIALFSFILSAPSHADLIPALQIDEIGEDVHNDFAWTLGFSFLANEDITVGGLGYYDANADGLLEDHLVGLWSEQGELLASTVVGSQSYLEGLFRWEMIAPIYLTAGQQYVVAGWNSIDDYTYEPNSRSVHSAIDYLCSRYGFGEELTYPEDTHECHDEWTLFGLFGANIQIIDDHTSEPPIGIPAPGSLSLVLLVFAILLARHRANTARSFPSTLGIYAVLSVGTMAFSPLSFALTATGQATQGDANWDSQVPLGNRYLRYSHLNVGGTIEYDNVFDVDGNYIVPVGEKLRWVWQRKGVSLSYLERTYVGGEDRCWQSSQGSRSCAGPTAGHNRFLATLQMRCQPESDSNSDYTLLLYRNGEPIGRYEFGMERFKMRLTPSSWNYPRELKPMASSKAEVGEKQPLSIRVSDDLNCNAKLADVQLTLQSFVGNDVNHHQHFSAGDKGTGKFVEVFGFDASKSEDDTKAVGKTNSSGVFNIEYQAMHFALAEDVKLTFVRPAKDGEAEQRQQATINWRIKYGNYVPDPYGLPFVFSGSCPRTHVNGGATHLRADVWPQLKAGLDAFTAETGKRVTLNDASFPWGGAADNKDSACNNHGSHRVGIDIDINGTLVGGTWHDLVDELAFIAIIPEEGGTDPVPYIKKSMLTILTDKMNRNGFEKAIEDPIHYRKR